MLTFVNTTVTIKDKDGFLFYMKTKLYLAKRKTAPSPIWLEVNFTTNEDTVSTVKGSAPANDLRWLWSAIIFISLDFQRETFLIYEKHIAKKQLYMHRKAAASLILHSLDICHTKLIYYSDYCGLELGYFQYHLKFVSQIWTSQNASLQKGLMKPKPVQYYRYAYNYF